MSRGGYVIGVDLGGTTTSVARVWADGSLDPITSMSTEAARGAKHVLSVLDAAIDAARITGRPPLAVGIGATGAVNAATGTIAFSTETIPGWGGTRLADHVAGRQGVPVSVENDLDAYARGEYWMGAAQGAPSALVVAIGTGVGASLLRQGRPLPGAHHMAGEIGHMPSPLASDLPCPCGKRGHLEGVAAGPAILRMYSRQRPEAACISARDVAGRCQIDPVAREVLTVAGTALGLALAALVAMLDPDVVVLGGKVTGAGTTWWEACDNTVRSSLSGAVAQVPIVKSSLQDHAPILGAAHLAWESVPDGVPDGPWGASSGAGKEV